MEDSTVNDHASKMVKTFLASDYLAIDGLKEMILTQFKGLMVFDSMNAFQIAKLLHETTMPSDERLYDAFITIAACRMKDIIGKGDEFAKNYRILDEVAGLQRRLLERLIRLPRNEPDWEVLAGIKLTCMSCGHVVYVARNVYKRNPRWTHHCVNCWEKYDV